jgi:D-serine deaminase-like pyridoxal phosphate-dependent protein
MKYPILFLNKAKTLNNIKLMSDKANNLNLAFRPHFKTHQSYEIGSWFHDYGVTGITVSSVSMAEYFAHQGWKDITIAFPVNILDVKRIIELAQLIRIRLIINSIEVASFLDKHLSSNIAVYIEIDPDYGRSGINIYNNSLIESLTCFIDYSKNLSFEGFYAHAGHTYKATNNSQVEALANPLLKILTNLKSNYGGKLCWGDTPSCSILNKFEEIDELSPGNFIFYDWMQYRIGACNISDISVVMKCPVVAKFDDRLELLIHGGAVHFSKEYVMHEAGKPNYGQVINPLDSTDTSNFIRSLSQEHGIVECTNDFFNRISIGDIIDIYPIHSCLTANLMKAYVTETGEKISHFGSGAPFTG